MVEQTSRVIGQSASASRRRLRDIRAYKANRFVEVGLFDDGHQVATVGHFSHTWWMSTNILETLTSGVILCSNAAAAFALARLAPRVQP